ncbi:uncharacterized protein LOC134214945 isoform X1 [Armigeres subalbatus]|uniref:uncharacterized protein LOC134214945 isoform X1 n=1 Tax=Armigeres subalbatus TaxID=124917 RepID=UPI002ED22E42
MTSSKKLRLDLEESGEPAVHSPESGALFLNEEYLEQLEGTSSDPLSAHIDYDPNLSESQFSDAEQEKNLNEGFSRDKLPAGLYGCWLLVAVRNFKGHSSGKEVGRWGVAGNSVDEFMNSCWKLSHTFLKREVVFTCDESGVAKPSWSEKVSPEEDDFVRFALFNDKVSHRTLRPDQVTETILQNWRTKEIHLLLHVYSTAVNNKAVFQSVRDTLMGPGTLDKSGAASNATIDELSAKLRGEHGLHWEAHNVAWMMWANVIAVSEPHVQEGMIYDAPPAHLAKLFRAKEQPRVQSISRNFSMAHSVNDGYQDDISAIKRSFNQLEEMLRGVNKGMQLLKKHIESLESRAVLGDSFLSAAEQAVLVEETGFSSSLARNVTDAEDVDHM